MHKPRKDKSDHPSAVTGFVEARLIALCANQIDVAADEAFREVSSLSRAVLDSAQRANEMLAASEGRQRVDGVACVELRALQETLQRACTRLQFADRLCQRLSNVSTNLAGLAKLMRSEDLPITDKQWGACLDAMRANFTMEQERQMFDATFKGGATNVNAGAGSCPSDELTLFDKKAGYDSR